jgi:ATP-binding cassette subfamily B protein
VSRSDDATASRAASRDVGVLRALLPFLAPYRGRIAFATVFLLLAAATTLVLPVALGTLIDRGLVPATNGERLLAVRDQFLWLFAVGIALGLFSAARFYTVSWIGERLTADLRTAVYAHVVQQSPEFFETTRTGRSSRASRPTRRWSRHWSAPASRWGCATSSWASARSPC